MILMTQLAHIMLLFKLIAVLHGVYDNQITIFLIGDSTMADKDTLNNPERGWGMYLNTFFSDKIRVQNHAKNGRSSKSFRDQGLWDSVLTNLKRGDYVFIQFGHNDAKMEDTTRYAEAGTTYQQNLIRYIREIRAKHAIPVILTPVVRRKFESNNKLMNTHGKYPDVVRQVALKQNVQLIDINLLSQNYLEALGDEKSRQLFLHFPPGVVKKYPDGIHDDTHFSETGARIIAYMVVNEIKTRKMKLARYIKKDQLSYYE